MWQVLQSPVILGILLGIFAVVTFVITLKDWEVPDWLGEVFFLAFVGFVLEALYVLVGHYPTVIEEAYESVLRPVGLLPSYHALGQIAASSSPATEDFVGFTALLVIPTVAGIAVICLGVAFLSCGIGSLLAGNPVFLAVGGFTVLLGVQGCAGIVYLTTLYHFFGISLLTVLIPYVLVGGGIYLQVRRWD